MSTRTKHRSVYLSGPMTGYPNYNFAAFAEAAARWRSVGWEVLSPHESFGGDQAHPLAAYMREDVEMLVQVDGVALLPGWEDSVGARFEVLIAQKLGLDFYHADSMGPAVVPKIVTVLDRAMYTKTEVWEHTDSSAELAAAYGVPHGDYHAELMDETLFRSDAEIEAILDERGIGKRVFTTGATRDTDEGKLDYEGFLSPLVLRRYAEFMHQNRQMRDGSLRASDNWQKGIPRDAYLKSAFRHFMEWWSGHRQGHVDAEALTALMFNVMGYLHEHLKAGTQQVAA